MMKKKGLEREIKKAINDSLANVLHEAYVTVPKKYDLRTDFLSDQTKKALYQEFGEFVAALNRVSAELDGADRENANNKASSFRDLKLDEVHNMNASFLRALYFENISDLDSRITMDTLTFIRLERDFGTFDEWQKDFIACCMSSRDGYALTGYSIFLKRYINFVIDNEAKNVPIGVLPLIVLDVNAGAYFRDYLNDRRAYVMAMMKEFNWERIETRFKRAEKVAKVATE
jgi:Fe-Mn family superoxide dismutase